MLRTKPSLYATHVTGRENDVWEVWCTNLNPRYPETPGHAAAAFSSREVAEKFARQSNRAVPAWGNSYYYVVSPA